LQWVITLPVCEHSALCGQHDPETRILKGAKQKSNCACLAAWGCTVNEKHFAWVVERQVHTEFKATTMNKS
jgi:hypothetical protein